MKDFESFFCSFPFVEVRKRDLKHLEHPMEEAMWKNEYGISS